MDLDYDPDACTCMRSSGAGRPGTRRMRAALSKSRRWRYGATEIHAMKWQMARWKSRQWAGLLWLEMEISTAST
jgi:hypothetical protein